MDRLPLEIIKMVVEYIDTEDDWAVREDLKSLRLVTRQLSDLVTPSLFRTIPLWISLQSLQNLSDIAEHPYL